MPCLRAAAITVSPGRNSTVRPSMANVSGIAASADTGRATAAQHVLLHLIAEVAEQAARHQRRGRPEAAGRADAHRLGELVVAGRGLLAGDRALREARRLIQQLPQAHGADPAGVALAAALALEEAQAVAGKPHDAVAFVEDDDAAGAQERPLAERRRVVQRYVEGGRRQ